MEDWSPLRWTAATVLLVLAVIALSWGGYLTYLRLVEGPAITQHAQNVRHSLDFTQSANQRAESYITDYTVATNTGDTAHAAASKNQACSAAHSINPDEQVAD